MSGIWEGIRRNVIVLGVVSFLTDVSSEMVFPIIPLFLTNILGAGKEIVGLIEGIADSIASILDIFFGYWSDLRGKRKDFVIAGYGLSTVLKAGLVFATTWPLVLFIRGAERIGKSIRTSPRDAIIAESTDEKSRGKAFGLHRMMDTLGAITGPAIAYVILSALGQTESAYRTVFLFALIPAALAVLVIIFFVKEPATKANDQAAAVKKDERPLEKKLGFWQSLRVLNNQHWYKEFLLISCLFSLAYFSFALLIVRASDLSISPQDILILYLIYNVSYALVSIPAGSLSDRIGRRPVIAASFLLYALICIGFVYADGFSRVLGLFVLYGIFVAVDESVNKAYIADMVDNKTRGIALGAYNTAVGALYLPASALFGVVWVSFGAGAAFGCAAAIATIAGILIAVQSEKIGRPG